MAVSKLANVFTDEKNMKRQTFIKSYIGTFFFNIRTPIKPFFSPFLYVKAKVNFEYLKLNFVD